MIKKYKYTIKVNETKVMIKKTGEIGMVVGIKQNANGDCIVRVKIPSMNPNYYFVYNCNLTDVVPCN